MAQLKFIRLVTVFSIAICLAAFLAGSSQVEAQTQSGSITGIISDTTSAGIPGASVVVLDTETGVKHTATTDNKGYFTVPLLPQGTYSVSVVASGFGKAGRRPVILNQGQVLRLDLSLAVGGTTTSVEVTSEPPALDRETTALSTVIEKQQVLDLPLNSRNTVGVLSLIPGVRGIGGLGGLATSAYGDGRAAISGGTPSTNAYQFDGIADENQTSGGPSMTPSVDATQEVQIITHNASAQYGRTGGGVINFVSKSGTNKFHGSLWEFAQNSALNANDFFSKAAGRSITPFSQNQYGVTVGGPIRHDKTFFFANWEGFGQTTPARGFLTLPTDLQKQGDFSQTFNSAGALIPIYDPLSTVPDPAHPGHYIRTQFQGNKIPAARMNPVAVAASKYYPEPNLPGAAFTGLNNFLGTANSTISRNNYGLRLDQFFTPTRQLVGRYTVDTTNQKFPQYLGADNPATFGTSNTTYLRKSVLLSYSDALRSNLLLEISTGMNRFGINRMPVSRGFDATKLGFPAAFNSQQQYPVFPYMSFQITAPLGSNPGDDASQRGNAFQLGGALTWVHGTHTFKGGAEGRLYQWNSVQGDGLVRFAFSQSWTQGPDPSVSATNGYSYASFLLGNPASGTLYRHQNYEYSTYYYTGYLQDDWKITPRLTANLGVRWDHELPTTARHNNMANFDPTITTVDNGINLKGGLVYPGVNGLSRGNRNATWNNFAPRVGLAYQLTPTTVLRGAFGIFYLPTTQTTYNISDTGFSSATSYLGSVTPYVPYGSLSNPFPDGIVEPTGSSLGALTALGSSINGDTRSLVAGTSQQYGLNLQQQVGSWTVEIGYVANHGLHLPADYAYGHLNQSHLSLGTALLDQVANPYASIISAGALAQPTVTRGTLLTDYPQFTGVTSKTNWAGSNYQSGTVRVQRRYSNGFSLLGAYTWSKYLDNNLGNGHNNSFVDSGSNSVQNWDNLNAEKAISTSSQPQHLVVTGNYLLPFVTGSNRFVRGLTDGWKLNAIFSAFSGNVIAVTANAPTYGGSRPNIIGNPRPSHRSYLHWLNPAAFQTIPAYTFGNSPRNLPGTLSPATINLDASVFKEVKFSDRYRVEFRLEAFNALNHTTFGNPGSTLGQANFGVISGLRSGTAPRRLQIGVKGYF